MKRTKAKVLLSILLTATAFIFTDISTVSPQIPSGLIAAIMGAQLLALISLLISVPWKDTGPTKAQAAATVEAEEQARRELEEERQPDVNSLLFRFEYLMNEDKVFLQQGITVQDIADMLKSNKTYISQLVNRHYHTSFPEYINTLRVDYAEQYLLKHRDAKQAEIANACGFPNASSFNSTFKQITGMTPKVWTATH